MRYGEIPEYAARKRIFILVELLCQCVSDELPVGKAAYEFLNIWTCAAITDCRGREHNARYPVRPREVKFKLIRHIRSVVTPRMKNRVVILDLELERLRQDAGR